MGHYSLLSFGVSFWVVVIWASLHACRSNNLLAYECHPEEKEALLQLKSSFLSANFTPPASWREGKDCCSWEGVKCNNISRRVSELLFSSIAMRADRNYSSSFGPWDLNFSIFAAFSGLRHLDLSDNDIVGSLEYKELSGLKMLEVLDLSGNGFTGRFPMSIGNISSLQVLNLYYNSLSGSFSTEAFRSLRNMRELHLSQNRLYGNLPRFLYELPYLQDLDLSGNSFQGNVPPKYFANITSLQHIDLSQNYLHGHFSFLISFANLSKLQEVILSNNDLAVELDFQGWVPPFQLKALKLSNCNLNQKMLAKPIFLSSQYQLELVDLSQNKLLGETTNWFFGNNQTTLKYLNLRNNSITGSINLPSVSKVNLQAIDMSSNSIRGSLPDDIGLTFPNLIYLNFSGNHFFENVPLSLCNNSELLVLDLSNNNFFGELPTCLMTDCHALQSLRLSNNNLHGNLFIGNHKLSTFDLYLDGNNLNGTLPHNLSGFSDLQYLDLHDNQLSGSLPDSIGSITNLEALNLGGNHFEGHLPHQLCNLKYLYLLIIFGNRFTGLMPPCDQPLGLYFLDIAGNAFSGVIINSFVNSSYLRTLDARNNQFSGSLSHWIADLQAIKILFLSGNQFEGPLTVELCKLHDLHLLDLSSNSFSESIPRCLGNIPFGKNSSYDDQHFWVKVAAHTDLLVADYFNVEFDIAYTNSYDLQEVEFSTKGNFQSYKRDLVGLMTGIDLSSNKLTGEIPAGIGNMSSIKALNLSNNQLVGLIPETFSNLNQIESLDLSYNRLSGMIPPQLTQLTNLEVFSVAHNKLSGCTPDFRNQFATFNTSSYLGNADLHGPPLEKTCNTNSNQIVPPEEQFGDDGNIIDHAIFYAVVAVSYVVGFWVCIAVLFFHHAGQRIRARVIDHFVDSLTNLISNKLKPKPAS